jgi:peptide/nickel transport system substrate-binding protein
MSKTIRTLIFTLLILSLALAACGPTGTEQVPGPGTEPDVSAVTPSQPSGAVSIAQVTRLDPATAETEGTLIVAQHVYEGLTYLEGSQAKPLLATEWSISENGLEYTFVLRQGVSFHDGTLFNADAVIVNFNRWFDPENPLHGSAAFIGWEEYFLAFKGEVDDNGRPLSFFDGVEKVNDYTILFHLNRAEPNFVNLLASPYFAFASPSMLTSADADDGSSMGEVAGTGPYTVATWTDTGITLAPNVNYWGEVPEEALEFQFE